MVQIKQKGLWLSGYFLLMMFLFTRGFYNPFFVLLIGLFLIIVFLKEENRLFGWMIISFFLGNLLLGYMDNFIEGFHFSPFSLIMLSQLLLLIPILMISYVVKQFKQEITSFFHRPIFTREIQLPFKIDFSFKRFVLIFGLLAVVSIGITFLFQVEKMHWRSFSLILLFASMNALLEEVLWRGILLPKLICITNQLIGIIVTSIAYGINTTMFGFSPIICMIYIFLGFVLGCLTVKTRSVFPAMITHTLVTTLFLINGLMTIPVYYGS
ncbi:CPBP family intramembrane glutamic endopeptidase [Bacillus sp. X1(2014)]|uniref:CPBP family intramembrane glutamic endopeptidase n=1 Tax=Bacillus sp. X1(2014) TaxID=1565991 RepID=UPI0016424087|nr:CPBP family intramembrane glutamic endopeptidase [Bacillus sp. X1(2014)]